MTKVMSAVHVRLADLIEEWRPELEARAFVRFEMCAVPEEGLTPAAKADCFAGRFGFQSIGFNWEMLDPGEDMEAPRSARATMVKALANDMVRYDEAWLGKARALAFSDAFLEAFDPARRIVLSNHLNGLWYPISGAKHEWSFIVMDQSSIALLVLAGKA